MDVKNNLLPHVQGLLQTVLAAGVFLSLTRAPCHHFLLPPQFFEGERVSPRCTGGNSGERGRAEGPCQETPLTSLPLHSCDVKVMKSRVTVWKAALCPLLSVLETKVITFHLAIFIPEWLNLVWQGETHNLE